MLFLHFRAAWPLNKFLLHYGLLVFKLLANRYELTAEQVAFIDSKIKPMELEFDYD